MRIALERSLQLLGELARLCAGAGGKAADEFREAGVRHFRRKVNARDARRGKHSREAFLRRRGFEGRAVEQQLIARNGQQQARFVVRAESGAQFRPGGFVLLGRARMAEVIHPRELQQNIQAAHEGASSCGRAL